MNERYEILDGFFADAEPMRAQVDRHFSEPMSHGPQHQVWNYWYVPETYTYLRTVPEKVIEPALVQAFVARLSALAFERYGLGRVFWPYLSVYVAGCVQGLHNDSGGGRLGYVYSLTRWTERSFSGGETLLFRDQPYFGSAAMTRPAATQSFYDLVPPVFNRLLVFDDRVPHAVPRIEGGMDPRAGRIVLHGHFAEAGIHVEGALKPEQVQGPLTEGFQALAGLMAHAEKVAHGLVSLRLVVIPDGTVAGVQPLLDRLLPTGPTAIAGLGQLFAEGLGRIRFPPAEDGSRITVPIKVGAAPV